MITTKKLVLCLCFIYNSYIFTRLKDRDRPQNPAPNHSKRHNRNSPQLNPPTLCRNLPSTTEKLRRAEINVPRNETEKKKPRLSRNNSNPNKRQRNRWSQINLYSKTVWNHPRVPCPQVWRRPNLYGARTAPLSAMWSHAQSRSVRTDPCAKSPLPNQQSMWSRTNNKYRILRSCRNLSSLHHNSIRNRSSNQVIWGRSARDVWTSSLTLLRHRRMALCTVRRRTVSFPRRQICGNNNRVTRSWRISCGRIIGRTTDRWTRHRKSSSTNRFNHQLKVLITRQQKSIFYNIIFSDRWNHDLMGTNPFWSNNFNLLPDLFESVAAASNVSQPPTPATVAAVQQEQQQRHQHQQQNNYLWGSSSVWQPWTPAAPRTPTRTPPGFDDFVQTRNLNEVHKHKW